MAEDRLYNLCMKFFALNVFKFKFQPLGLKSSPYGASNMGIR